jgi:hypothetical protein
VDPILQTRFLSYSLTVDGVAKGVSLGAGSGPSGHALASGERKGIFLQGGSPWLKGGYPYANHEAAFDWSLPHRFTVTIGGTAKRGLSGEPNTSPTKGSHYEAGPLFFDPKVHPLADAWDKF